MRRTVPIVSGNVKYLGLSIPEWTFALSPLPLYFIFSEGNARTVCMGVHAVIIFLYIFFLSKLEENILEIIRNNLKIPNIVEGFFVRPLPISKKESHEHNFNKQ
jgi:hypothetical protein